MDRVMVGVDASDASVEALRRAVDEARWRDAVLEVVYVFDPPEQVTAFPVPPSKGSDVAPDIDEVRARARDQLEAWVRGTGVELDQVKIEWSVLADRRPARALIERSGGVELVVVGSRGRGGFAGLTLGSVSEQVTRHAKAPVLVVRGSTA